MSNDAFDSQLLAEKLSKLNNSQQSIESLSRWCIHHRDKARKIVETWEKLFNSRQKEQRVSFLYLANDILQNSKRLGNEFVSEFWKVLPSGLKQVYDNGDEQGKKAVTRLVNIWEERKVFGSRGSGLKDELLGKNPPQPLATNGKVSSIIKIVKRDAQSVRIKLAVGSVPEKILTAFQAVLDEQHNEEELLSTCNCAVIHTDKIAGELETINPGNQPGSALANELQEQEHVLQQCVDKLESAEATRHILLSQLKEAIKDQEIKMAMVHSQLQVARGQIEHANNLRKSLNSGVHIFSSGLHVPSTESSISQENNMAQIQSTSPPPHHQLPQAVVSFAPVKTSEDESKKAAAAAVAAKLTASTSSAQMLTSVLSSLVAEEAAMNTGAFNSLSHFQAEKRQKLEKPLAPPDGSSTDAGKQGYFSALQPTVGSTMAQIPPTATSMQQPISQSSFGSLPPLPPPAPTNSSTNQYVQTPGMMSGVMPYGYGGSSLPPPPPLPPHIAMGLARPGSQMSPPQPQPQQPQAAGSSGYYRPPGIGFYGQNHQAPPPPVQRQ